MFGSDVKVTPLFFFINEFPFLISSHTNASDIFTSAHGLKYNTNQSKYTTCRPAKNKQTKCNIHLENLDFYGCSVTETESETTTHVLSKKLKNKTKIKKMAVGYISKSASFVKALLFDRSRFLMFSILILFGELLLGIFIINLVKCMILPTSYLIHILLYI